MTLLEVSDLRVRLQTPRGPADAVRGVGFTIEHGQTLGLIGESGCGKSITALALMGLAPDSATVSGSVRLEGRELVGASESELCKVRGDRIAMIFQEPMTALNPVHTIGRQSGGAAAAAPQGVGCKSARAWKRSRCSIGSASRTRAARFDAYPHQFSGGQRQRIGIAMALACGPDLLIADEPTTALDATIQQQVLNLIRELVAERGMGLLLISHDLRLIARNAQQMLVMYGGLVVERGPTERVFAEMAHPYTRGLFAARPRLGARGQRLATIAGSVSELIDLPKGCPFAGRCGFTTDACSEALPAPVPVSTDHSARCIRLDVVAAAAAAERQGPAA